MRWPYIISLIALLGAGLLLFFNILCGASTSSVLGEFYWLEAGTSGIPGAHSTTRWTNYNSCGVRNGRNYDCTSSSAAYPMSPRANFGTDTGVPSGLRSRHGITYYLSRVGWAFLLLGLLFTLLALLPVAVSLCLPSLSILGIGSNFATNAALLFTILAAALLTAAYVKARNSFRSAGNHTSLGRKMFAFVWTSVFLLLLSSCLSGVGCCGALLASKKKKRGYNENYDSSSHETYGNNYINEKPQEESRGGFFSRNKKKQGEDLEDVGYAAGLGAAGVGTGAAAAGGKTRGVAADDATRDPETGETLEDVGYAAGLGASGATSDTTRQPEAAHTKDSSGLGTAAGFGTAGALGAAALGHNSKKKDTIPEGDENEYSGSGYDSTTNPKTGENIDDVGYAAGYGASGANSGKTRDLTGNSGTSRGHHSNEMYGTGVSNQDYYNRDPEAVSSSKPYDTGAATGYNTTDPSAQQSGSKKGVWGAAAAALGLGGAAAAHEHNKNATDATDSAYARDASGSEPYGAAGTTSGATDQYGSTTDPRGPYVAGGKGTSGSYGNEYSSGSGAGTSGYQDQTNYGSSKSGSGYGTTAAGTAAGAAAGYGLASSGNKKDTTTSGGATHGPAYYDPEGTDHGEGATRAGANAAKEDAARHQYENKSTALPVGQAHYSKDSYGNTTSGYDTGVPNDGASSAATAAAAGAGAAGLGVAASGKNSYRPSAEGAAVAPEDTYKNLYANSKNNNDLTTTSGYEPTNYYTRKTGEEFNTGEKTSGTEANTGDNVYGSAKSGGTGNEYDSTSRGVDDGTTASGAAKGGFLGAFLGRGNRKSTNYDNEDLAKRNSTSSSVYDSYPTDTTSKGATGAYGSSRGEGLTGNDIITGKGSKSTGPTGTSESATTGPNGESLKDVGYAAGLGASGATADKSKLGSSSSGASKGTSKDQNKYGQDYSSGKTSSSSGKGDVAASAAAALGLGSAASAAGSSKKGSSDYDNSKYSSTSGTKDDAYSGRDSKDVSTSTDKYSGSKSTGAGTAAYSGSKKSHDSTSAHSGYGNYETDQSKVHAVVDPARNRNPIAEGLTSGGVGKPTEDASSVPAEGVASNKGTDVSGNAHKDQSHNFGSTAIGSKKSGPSTGDKLESGVSGKDRSSGSKVAGASSNRGEGANLSTGDKLSGGQQSSSSYGRTAGTAAAGAAAAAAAAGLGAASSGSSKSRGDTYDSTSGRNQYSSDRSTGRNQYSSDKTTGAGLGAAGTTSSSNYGTSAGNKTTSATSGRYDGEDYYKDDSIPGTFPSEQVSSPTQRAVDTSDDRYYTTQGNQSSLRSGADKTTPRSAQQNEQVEYDAQGNPIKKESNLLDVIVDTAKSVI